MTGHWWFIFLAIVAGNSFAFQCPERSPTECNCQQSHNGDFEFHCPIEEETAFIVNILPNEYIQVQCLNSPLWSAFPPAHLAGGQSIESMYFRMCSLPNATSLGEIAEKLGVENVEKLIFQSFGNLSTSLTRQHLDGFPNLKKLILSSNSLTNLSGDIFANVPHITWLDLRENRVELSSGIFENTPELEVLELGNNMMQSIEPGTFDNLSKLRLLNLWKNKLADIESGTFDKLVSLKSLDINTNGLATLRSNVFAKLQNLETLNLFGNNFTFLPEGLLQGNTQLKVVNLYNNKKNMTTLPHGFFANLTELKVVKLKRNGFFHLPEDLFWGSPALTNVSLDRNFLTSLPKRIFRDSNQLITLELSFNDITELPDGIFSNTSRLISLDLSKNAITAISKDLFTGLKSLEILNMEQNRLKVIHESSFSSLKQLRIAKFANNFLTLNTSLSHYTDEYGTKSPFHDCSSLEELYLSRNNVTEIFSDWILSSLKLRKLDLKYNNISYITAEDLQFVSSNIEVDLTYNNIQHIYLNSAEQVAGSDDFRTSRDVIILVENNPMICDCNLYDFLRYLEGKMHPNVQDYFHIKPGNLTCQGPEYLANTPIAQLKSKHLKCVIENPDFGAKCPEQCTCWLRPEDRAYLIDCSYRNLTQVPMNITNPPHHHLELNFTGNSLTRMLSLKDMGLANEQVTMLLYSNNNISEVTTKDLSLTMRVLELHNNNITKMDTDVLHFMSNATSLKRTTLHENPWSCNCDTIDFLNFIQAKVNHIPSALSITCANMDTPMLKMTATEFCPLKTGMIVGVSLAIALTGMIIGTLAALYYRYQREIKVWLYAHQWCLWFVTEDELDKDKLYDAFISYSHKDEQFVVNELVANLESGPRPFKLCLHFRDWLAGEWIPTQIARSVEDSRRTIVVLSPNFLESVWGRMEFRAAHSQALSEGRARVILILFGEIGETDDLDPELKAYLSMNTYVKWGDPWFWDKLRYALPHPPEFTKKAITRKIFEKHQPTIQLNAEKKELIYPHSGLDTPLAATTPPADSLKVFICDEKTEAKVKDGAKETLIPNGNSKLILTPEQLLKNHSIINTIQCTTV